MYELLQKYSHMKDHLLYRFLQNNQSLDFQQQLEYKQLIGDYLVAVFITKDNYYAFGVREYDGMITANSIAGLFTNIQTVDLDANADKRYYYDMHGNLIATTMVCNRKLYSNCKVLLIQHNVTQLESFIADTMIINYSSLIVLLKNQDKINIDVAAIKQLVLKQNDSALDARYIKNNIVEIQNIFCNASVTI